MSFVTLEKENNSFHLASPIQLVLYSDSFSGLLNFGLPVVDFKLLDYSDKFVVEIMDRSVLLSFEPAPISEIPFLQAIVTFDSGVSGYVYIPILYRDYVGSTYVISATGLSSLTFPRSRSLSISDDFSLSLVRSTASTSWQEQFTCRYVSGGVIIDLVQNVIDNKNCNFSFDNIPSGVGRIELFNIDVLAWSFAVEFT